MSRPRGRRALLALFFATGSMTVALLPLPAQVVPDQGLVAAAGEQYRAGPFHRWILGRHYRDVWTTPVEVELLDLRSFAGGLVPLRTGGGQQTRSLRFAGADGREYSFRSVDKDPSAVLDPVLRGTVVADLVQDGISAAHPYGAVVAAPLLEAAGILHVTPRLALMPDDPSLGEFREEFAGTLGLIEERPDENEGDRAAFAGTLRVIASETLTDRLDRGPDDRVDARAFLAARLMDVFLGDWDRHRGQWRWAIYDDEEPRMWLPVPRDRDQAFSKFDGVATRIVSLYMPQFVRFEESYPSITRLHWNGRALDRWFLSGLERDEWESVGVELKAQLTDAIIEESVRQLPIEIQRLNGAELEQALKARRDNLEEALDDFYRLLAVKVDIQGTDADEVVVVDRSRPGLTRVTISTPGAPDLPHFDRTFVSTETDEVRLYLKDGDDRVLFQGDADTDIGIRVTGGEGDDRYDFDADGSNVRVYDFQGDDRVSGSDAPRIDDRAFTDWVWSAEDRDQPRDWGRRSLPIFWSSYSSDLGVFVGGGARVESYGFRKKPFSSGFNLRGGFATAVQKGRLEVDGIVNRENSRTFVELGGRVSRLDVIHYFGLGNATTSAGMDFHEVDQTVASVALGLGIATGPRFRVSGGLALERLSTKDTGGGFYETLGAVYGGGVHVQSSATLKLTWDPLSDSDETAQRVRVEFDGAAFPGLFDVERVFGRSRLGVSALLQTSNPFPWASLALRGSLEAVWGRFPWHQAAFLGGTSSLRGWDEQRFAGDRAGFGSAELRLRLWRPRVIVPATMGTFGFADAGRVALDGASTGGWHSSLGGGIWFQPVTPAYLLQLGMATSDEATKVFIALGLPY